MTLNYTELQVEQEARRALSHVTRRLAEDWLALHAEVTRLWELLAMIEQIVTTDRAVSAATGTRILMAIQDEQARAALRPEEP